MINHKRPSSFRTNFNYLSGMKSSRFLLTMVRKNPKLRWKLFCIHGIYIYIYIYIERERERERFIWMFYLSLYASEFLLLLCTFNFLSNVLLLSQEKENRNRWEIFLCTFNFKKTKLFITDTNLVYVFIFVSPIKYIFAFLNMVLFLYLNYKYF